MLIHMPLGAHDQLFLWDKVAEVEMQSCLFPSCPQKRHSFPTEGRAPIPWCSPRVMSRPEWVAPGFKSSLTISKVKCGSLLLQLEFLQVVNEAEYFNWSLYFFCELMLISEAHFTKSILLTGEPSFMWWIWILYLSQDVNIFPLCALLFKLAFSLKLEMYLKHYPVPI